MKRTISKWIGIAIMAGAIAFGLIQMRIPVVRADGCPDNPFPYCYCTLNNYTTTDAPGEPTHYYCVYDCTCGGGGGDNFFLIQREYVY